MKFRWSYTLLLGIGSLLLVAASCNSGEEQPEENGTEQRTEDDFPEIKALTQQIENNPNNAELYFNRGDAYTRLGYFKKAITDLEQAIELDPDVNYYHVRLSDIYLLEENPRLNLPDSRKAIEILEAYLNDHPEDQLVLKELALSHFYVDQYEESIGLFSKAIEQKAFNPEAYFYIGLNHKYAGDTVRAISNFQKAVEQDPEYYDGYMQLGLLLSQRKNNLALTYFDNAIQIDPRSTEAIYGKAKFLQDTRRYSESKRVYRQLAALDPQRAETYFNLGYIYLDQDSLAKAYSNFDRALQVDPAYADAYFGRGVVLEAQGDTAAAVSNYRNALNIQAEHPGATQALQELGITN